MHVPVVAATRLEGHVAEPCRLVEHGQIAVADEVLGKGSVRFTFGPDGAQSISFLAEPRAEFVHHLLAVAHVDGTTFVGGQLRSHLAETAQGGDGHNLAVGSSELVASEDVAEEVRLQVVVILRTEVVVELATRHLRLVLHAQLIGGLGIVPFLRARPGLALLPVLLLILQHLTQHTQRIQRAWESRVGIELRESLLQFVDGYSVVERRAHGRLQPLQITLCHQAGTCCQSFLTLCQRRCVYSSHRQ